MKMTPIYERMNSWLFRRVFFCRVDEEELLNRDGEWDGDEISWCNEMENGMILDDDGAIEKSLLSSSCSLLLPELESSQKFASLFTFAHDDDHDDVLQEDHFTSSYPPSSFKHHQKAGARSNSSQTESFHLLLLHLFQKHRHCDAAEASSSSFPSKETVEQNRSEIAFRNVGILLSAHRHLSPADADADGSGCYESSLPTNPEWARRSLPHHPHIIALFLLLWLPPLSIPSPNLSTHNRAFSSWYSTSSSSLLFFWVSNITSAILL